MMNFSKSIAVALGGGGAKGNAHIGVLRRLDDAGFVVRAIAGTSFGGMVAVFYALGNSPDEIEKIFNSFDQSRLHGHSSGDRPSLLGIGGGKAWLQENLGDKIFADLKIPCAITATDLNNGREIILTDGSLLE